jgi:SARP family transcriptional regulator, regulator of embCAB operon
VGSFAAHPSEGQSLADEGRFHIALLGGFELRRGDAVLSGLTSGAQRLLAFLALRGRSVTRAAAADSLWPDVSEAHAYSSLRSAIVRLPSAVQGSVIVSPNDLRLADQVDVDLRDARALAHRLLNAGTDLELRDLDTAAINSLSADLLPNWYDDWTIMEAEGWRQLRLHALEAIAAHLLARGRHSDAADAALLAMQAEPLRESAHGMIIRIHLAQGNQSDALAAFAHYRTLLKAELGLEPTSQLSDLVAGI